MNVPAGRIADKIDPRKFRDPDVTADGSERASVALAKLETLWFNTGTLCNLTCRNCYIESSPRNDRLVYLTTEEVTAYLEEIRTVGFGTREIGITGGEPFMNPDIIGILDAALSRGHDVLVLTNAMRPMMKLADELDALRVAHGEALQVRVSIDHYTKHLHEEERGARSWQPMIDGLKWLSAQGFNLNVAGRTCWNEDEATLRKGFAAFFAEHAIAVDADDPVRLVLFPEMDETGDVPEITTACWDILGVAPDAMMCATSRMVVKRKGAEKPVIVPCTLLPYDEDFDMGHTLEEASRAVKLNHPHCARFCVLGGGSCS